MAGVQHALRCSIIWLHQIMPGAFPAILTKPWTWVKDQVSKELDEKMFQRDGFITLLNISCIA